MFECQIQPSQLNSIVVHANTNCAEAQEYLNMITHLAEEPFFVQFCIEVLSINDLSYQTYHYCFSALLKLFNRDRKCNNPFINFFYDFFLQNSPKFTDDIIIKDASLLFACIFRERDQAGLNIILKLIDNAAKNLYIQYYYAAHLSAAGNKEATQIVSKYFESFFNEKQVLSLQNKAKIFSNIFEIYTQSNFRPILTDTIIFNGFPKIFEISLNITDRNVVFGLLGVVAKMCHLNTECFKTESNKTSFCIYLANNLSNFVLSHDCINILHPVALIYSALSKTRQFRTMKDEICFDLFINSLAAISVPLLSIEMLINDTNASEIVLDTWLSIHEFQIIRENAKMKEKLYEQYSNIRNCVFEMFAAHNQEIIMILNENPCFTFIDTFSQIISTNYVDTVSTLLQNIDTFTIQICLEIFCNLIQAHNPVMDCSDYIMSDFAMLDAVFQIISLKKYPQHPNIIKSLARFVNTFTKSCVMSNKGPRYKKFEEDRILFCNVLFYLLELLSSSDYDFNNLYEAIHCFNFTSLPKIIIQEFLNNESFVELMTSLNFPFVWNEDSKSYGSAFVQNCFSFSFLLDSPEPTISMFNSLKMRMSDKYMAKTALHYFRSAIQAKNCRFNDIFMPLIQNFFPIFQEIVENTDLISPIAIILSSFVELTNTKNCFKNLSIDFLTFMTQCINLSTAILQKDASPKIVGHILFVIQNILMTNAFNLGVLKLYNELSIFSLIELVITILDQANPDYFVAKSFFSYFLSFMNYIISEEELFLEEFAAELLKITFENASSIVLLGLNLSQMDNVLSLLCSIIKKGFIPEIQSSMNIINSIIILYTQHKIQNADWIPCFNALISSSQKMQNSWLQHLLAITNDQGKVEEFRSILYMPSNYSTIQFFNSLLPNFKSFVASLQGSPNS